MSWIDGQESRKFPKGTNTITLPGDWGTDSHFLETASSFIVGPELAPYSGLGMMGLNIDERGRSYCDLERVKSPANFTSLGHVGGIFAPVAVN